MSICFYIVQFAKGETGFEPAASCSKTNTALNFMSFLSILRAFESENGAFVSSCQHCFHIVQICRWSKLRSTTNFTQITKLHRRSQRKRPSKNGFLFRHLMFLNQNKPLATSLDLCYNQAEVSLRACLQGSERRCDSKQKF